MEGFRTVCIIHEKKQVYFAYYLQGFFKWIGFSYFNYCLDREEKESIRKKYPKDYKFDFFLCIGEKEFPWWREEKERVNNKNVYYLEVENETDSLSLLKDVIEQVWEGKFLKEEKRESFLEEMAEIYHRNSLFCVLHSHTYLVLREVEDKAEEIKSKCRKALIELEALFFDREQENTLGTEYYFYASEYCKTLENSICLRENKALPYNIGESLERINTIYTYDSEFFRTEYLKAQMVLNDDLGASFAEFYLECCLTTCKVDICKSYYYYTIAKFLEGKGKYIRAEKNYFLAYQDNRTNIRAMFKVAVLQLKRKEVDLAEKMLNQICTVLDFEKNKRYLLPLELEYLFKSNMMLADFASEDLRKKYYTEAQNIILFIEEVGSSKDKNEFMEKMFQGVEKLKTVCDAMAKRLKRKRLDLYFLSSK